MAPVVGLAVLETGRETQSEQPEQFEPKALFAAVELALRCFFGGGRYEYFLLALSAVQRV